MDKKTAAAKRNRLLLDFASSCAAALACIEREDPQGLEETLNQRQEILDALAGLFPMLAPEEPTEEAGMQALLCEYAQLASTCLNMNKRLNAAGEACRDALLLKMEAARTREKIQSGYLPGSAAKGGRIGGA